LPTVTSPTWFFKERGRVYPFHIPYYAGKQQDPKRRDTGRSILDMSSKKN